MTNFESASPLATDFESASSLTTMSNQRRATRAPLNLPLRIRWQDSLRYCIEHAETLDVSRTGLLFYRTQPLRVAARLWVTYPYDKESPAQPETPARVARVRTTPGGGQLVALEFKPLPRPAQIPMVKDTRRATRTPVALPLFVRRPHAPWGEEAMTVDVSDGGMQFTTARQYLVDERLCVNLAAGRWAAAQGELAARVVRVEPIAESVEHRVALELERDRSRKPEIRPPDISPPPAG